MALQKELAKELVKGGCEGVVQTLVIPFELPGLNELLAAAGGVFRASAGRRRSRYTELKRQHEEALILLIRAQGLQPIPEGGYPVQARFLWVCASRRRDLDNIRAGGAKIVFDALVKAGILADDGWRHLSQIEDAFIVDRNRPRCEVTLTSR